MTPSDSPENVLVVRRVIPVPRERVFDAWLDAGGMVHWMLPGAATSATVEVDARVGGKFRMVMSEPSRDHEHTGEYLAIERPRLLSFTWKSEHTEHRATVVTVEFLDRGDATEVIVTHRRLPPTEIESHRAGWTDVLGLLGDELADGKMGR